MGHKGLICMGAVTDDYTSRSRESYFNTLVQGNDFGLAYLAFSNVHFDTTDSDPSYALLGAGSLRSKPYIQYGSHEVRYQSWSSGNLTLSTEKPVFIKNVSVTQNGGYQVTSTHGSSSPNCTYAEVKVRESVFSPTGANTVRLFAQ